jgi:hypothetical protein
MLSWGMATIQSQCRCFLVHLLCSICHCTFPADAHCNVLINSDHVWVQIELTYNWEPRDYNKVGLPCYLHDCNGLMACSR